MNYPDADDIAVINEVVIEESGGSIGTREPGLLDSIAQKPASREKGHESYPGVFLKAAALYEAIISYHVFVDGNKRTGFATMARFMAMNGYELDITDKEIENYTLAIASAKTDLADIAAWVKKHSKKNHI